VLAAYYADFKERKVRSSFLTLRDDLAHSLGGTPYSATGWRLEGQPLGDRFYGLLIKDPRPEILHLGKKLPHL